MRKLLLISYDFPPAIIGVRRILKWIHYLPESGWECAVLTVKPVRTARRDPYPLQELKERGVPIFRSGSLDPYRLAEIFSPRREGDKKARTHATGKSKSLMNFLRRWVFMPDDRCGWIPSAVARGFRLIRRLKPDAILTTSYPHSAHVTGLSLKLLTSVPWVADFRDAWTQNDEFFRPPTPLHAFLQHALEKWVARRCDLLLAVSEPISAHFRSLLGGSGQKVHTLTNGYDDADFAGLTSHPSEKFSLVYTGSLFGERTPTTFIRALNVLLAEHPEWRADFDVRFYSALDDPTIMEIRQAHLEDVIHVEGLCSYRESLQRQMDAAVLLLFIAPAPNADVMMTQKVFEYLRSGHHILAMIPEGACRSLLQQFEGVEIVHPADVEGIKSRMSDLYLKWKSGQLSVPMRKGIEQYDRRNLTAQLASLLDEISS